MEVKADVVSLILTFFAAHPVLGFGILLLIAVAVIIWLLMKKEKPNVHNETHIYNTFNINNKG